MTRSATDVDGTPSISKDSACDGTNHGIGDEVGWIREAIEKVPTLELRSERFDELPIRRFFRLGRVFEYACLRLVQTEHRPLCRFRLGSLDVVARCRRLRLQVQNRNPGRDGEDTAVTAQNAVVNLVAITPEVQRRDELKPAPAVRTSKKIERFNQHGGVIDFSQGFSDRFISHYDMTIPLASCSKMGLPVPLLGARRKYSRPNH